MLTGYETLQVRGNYFNGMPSGETFQTTTAAIADLGGGSGGITSEQFVDTGTTGSLASLSSYNEFDSASSGNKTLPIPTSTGSRTLIIVFDGYGNAGTYPITAVPQTGSIKGVNQVYTNGGSITLYDSSRGWRSI